MVALCSKVGAAEEREREREIERERVVWIVKSIRLLYQYAGSVSRIQETRNAYIHLVWKSPIIAAWTAEKEIRSEH
jgi:hypothetical protein